jgi:hypothetical protein
MKRSFSRREQFFSQLTFLLIPLKTPQQKTKISLYASKELKSHKEFCFEDRQIKRKVIKIY